MHINDTIGKRVLNVWSSSASPQGTVIAIEAGCNGGARVLWDGRDYSVAMVLSDLALVDTYPAPGSRLSEMKKDF